MFRTTLLLATLCVLVACDKTSTPTGPAPDGPAIVDPGTNGPGLPTLQSIRGTLRREMLDSVEVQWNLELGDGTIHRLIGGPLETYDALMDKAVFVVGLVQEDGTISVNTCEEDTQIYEEYGRRRVRAKK
jgi:hypothetical protein